MKNHGNILALLLFTGSALWLAGDCRSINVVDDLSEPQLVYTNSVTLEWRINHLPLLELTSQPLESVTFELDDDQVAQGLTFQVVAKNAGLLLPSDHKPTIHVIEANLIARNQGSSTVKYFYRFQLIDPRIDRPLLSFDRGCALKGLGCSQDLEPGQDQNLTLAHVFRVGDEPPMVNDAILRVTVYALRGIEFQPRSRPTPPTPEKPSEDLPQPDNDPDDDSEGDEAVDTNDSGEDLNPSNSTEAGEDRVKPNHKHKQHHHLMNRSLGPIKSPGRVINLESTVG